MAKNLLFFALIFKLIKGKGSLAILSRRNKRDLAEKIQHKEPAIENNIESGKDFIDENQSYSLRKEKREQSRGLFDEHFDDKDN